ncbi:MAG: glycosyltransferase family 4 protein [Myxococcales bacterium]|nr:glycosyltransferase family 4 protein [Myxococcales bacterium]
MVGLVGPKTTQVPEPQNGAYVATADRFFGDHPGGAYRIAWELARSVARGGEQSILLAGSLPKDPPEGVSHVDGVDIIRYRYDQSAPRSLRFHIGVASARRALRKWLPASLRGVVIHGHSLIPSVAAGAEIRHPRRRVYTLHSSVVHEQEINWEEDLRNKGPFSQAAIQGLRAVEHNLLKRQDGIHVLSQFMRERLETVHPLDTSERISVIPWWVDPAAFGPRLAPAAARARLGVPAEGPVILSVRRLVKRMGLDTLIRAVQRTDSPAGFRLVIVGQGPEETALRELAASHENSRSRTIFLGRVTDEALEAAYDAADLFVLPTRALEGFGIITVDALARGCPVLGTTAGATPEILAPLSQNLLFEPDNADQLAEKLNHWLQGGLNIPSRATIREYAQRYSRTCLESRMRELIFGPGLDT